MSAEKCPDSIKKVFKSDIIEFKTIEIEKCQELIKILLDNVFPLLPNSNVLGNLERTNNFVDQDGEYLLSVKYYSQASQKYQNKPAYEVLLTNKVGDKTNSFRFDLSELADVNKTKKTINGVETSYNSAWLDVYESIIDSLKSLIKK